MKKKYFLFLDKKVEITDYEESKDGKYNLSFNKDEIYFPYCDILYEDSFKDGHYEYVMGRYNECHIWETYLFFTSDKRLVVEEE